MVQLRNYDLCAWFESGTAIFKPNSESSCIRAWLRHWNTDRGIDRGENCLRLYYVEGNQQSL